MYKPKYEPIYVSESLIHKKKETLIEKENPPLSHTDNASKQENTDLKKIIEEKKFERPIKKPVPTIRQEKRVSDKEIKEIEQLIIPQQVNFSIPLSFFAMFMVFTFPPAGIVVGIIALKKKEKYPKLSIAAIILSIPPTIMMLIMIIIFSATAQ